MVKTPKLIHGTIKIGGDGPSQIIPGAKRAGAAPTIQQRGIARQIAATIGAYRKATKRLFDEKYSGVRHLVPQYLSEPGNVLAFICSDGMILRFEKNIETSKALVALVPESLSAFVPKVSQGLVYCHESRDFTSSVGTAGMEINLAVFDQNGVKKIDLFSMKVLFDSVIERPEELPKPPQKPFCLLSVRNAFEFQLHGILMDETAKDSEAGQPFMARSEMRLPVGWECLEVYPFFDVRQWKPEWAAAWAENDILGAVVATQLHESSFESLDPLATAREQYASLLRSYRELLDSSPSREEILQVFMRENPVLLCPSKVSMWPKLDLGAHQTDFVFREAAGDYLLVELERSTLNLFRRDGHPTQELTHAESQVVDWKRYLEDNLSYVQRELGLEGISTNPNSLIVIGRSQSLSADARRKLKAMENATPKLKIMTYDDVYDSAKAIFQNLLGPIWEHSGNTQIYYLTKDQMPTPLP